MASSELSDAEKTFILHGVQEGFREDGRSNEDFRPMEVETGLVSNTSGSARVRLANTDILVGVKAELGQPSPEQPHSGRIEFFVDCSANATPVFEGRGGEELAAEIGSLLSRAYSSPACLDLAPLSVISRQQCWILYVDVVLLECGGNLFDATSIAVKAALHNTRVPKVKVVEDEGGAVELEVSDDPFACVRLDVSSAPCIITLSKIGHSHVVDSSQNEESCCIGRLMMGVTEKGQVTALRKEGSGSLHPESVLEMMESGTRVGKQINKALMDVLHQDDSQKGKRKVVGFLK